MRWRAEAMLRWMKRETVCMKSETRQVRVCVHVGYNQREWMEEKEREECANVLQKKKKQDSETGHFII